VTPNAPEPFLRLVRELARLPGIGEKTAERLAFHLLRRPPGELRVLAEAVNGLQSGLRECRVCHNLSEGELCRICSDARRDETLICVVEMPPDLYRLEEACDYRGRYHVLGGRWAPLDGVFPEDLNLDSLGRRARASGVREVILALSPTTEGEATCGLVTRALSGISAKVSRLAVGLPAGAELGWVGRSSLQDALRFRRELSAEE